MAFRRVQHSTFCFPWHNGHTEGVKTAEKPQWGGNNQLLRVRGSKCVDTALVL